MSASSRAQRSRKLTVTTPAAGANVVAAAPDWETTTFQDPMDLSQRTDLEWWQFTVDAPSANLTNQTFSGGVLTATTTSTQPRFILLETGLQANIAVQTGRNGNVYPIDSTYYKVAAYRATLPQWGQGMVEYWRATSIRRTR